MSSKFLPGIGVGVAATAAVIALVVWLEPQGLSPSCAGATCTVPVSITSSALSPVCKISVSAVAGMPSGINRIKWTIATPGYSFVAGGDGVTILNNAADFSPAASTSKDFNLTRSPTVPVGRIYSYTLNIQRDANPQELCMVPTLPRIKNQ